MKYRIKNENKIKNRYLDFMYIQRIMQSMKNSGKEKEVHVHVQKDCHTTRMYTRNV